MSKKTCTDKMSQEQKKRVLLISCDDEKGIINSITNILLRFSCNIVLNREFVDLVSNKFYMRTEFEGAVNDEELILELRKVLPENAEIKIPGTKKKKVVILATKEHHCLSELLVQAEFNDMNIDIQAVIANHETLHDLVARFNIPFSCVPAENLSREEHEKRILTKLSEYDFEFMVLAKYMRILSPDFVGKFQNRIVNIHHSFLPAFIGANPYLQAFERGVKIIGATAHFVTDDLDQGPIITQEVKNINHTYSAQKMRKAGSEIEKIALVKALNLVCDDKVFINTNKTIIF